MTDGQLDLGIEREGESYRTYNYATKQMSKDLAKDELNGFLRDYDQRREEYAAAERERIESEQRRKNEIAEVDSFARENVKEYKTLSAPSQGMIRKVIREGRANGLSDSDVTMLARVSAHSGIDIQFDKEATYRGTKEEGSADYADGFYEASKNRIVVNPEGKRTAERLLIHELDHAIRKGDNSEFRIQNAEFEATKKKIDEEYGESKRNAEYFASYSEEMLTNKHSLEKLLEAEPTLKDKILSFFKGASTDYADVPKLAGAAKKYYRTYKKLFDEFSARNAENNAIEKPLTSMNQEDMSVSDRSYMLPDGLTDVDPTSVTEEEVKTLLERSAKKQYRDSTYLPVRINTPQILIDVAASRGAKIENLPVVMQVEKIRQSMATEEEWRAENKTSRAHDLSSDEVISIIKAMDQPKYIVYQTDNERYVEIVKYKSSKNTEGIAVIEIGEEKNPAALNGYKGGKYQILITAFNPDDGFIDSILNKTSNRVLYPKKKKGSSQRGPGNKVPSHLNDSPFAISIPQPAQKSNSFDKNSLENSSDKDFALDIGSEGENISGAEVMGWLNKKPEGDAAVSPVASDVDKKRITFTGSERVLENKQARLKAEYTTDKVFSQASVKRNFDKVDAVKKIPASVREDIARRLWIELEMSEGDEIRDSIALGYSVELFQAIRFADFERIRTKSSKTS